MAARKKPPVKDEPPASGGEGEPNEPSLADVQAELAALKAARDSDAAELEKLRKAKEASEAEAEKARLAAEEAAKSKMTSAERMAALEEELNKVSTKLAATSAVLESKVKEERARELAEKQGVIEKIKLANADLDVESLAKLDMQFLTQLERSLGVPEAQAIDDQVKKLNEQREERIERLREERRRKNGFK